MHQQEVSKLVLDDVWVPSRGQLEILQSQLLVYRSVVAVDGLGVDIDGDHLYRDTLAYMDMTLGL